MKGKPQDWRSVLQPISAAQKTEWSSWTPEFEKSFAGDAVRLRLTLGFSGAMLVNDPTRRTKGGSDGAGGSGALHDPVGGRRRLPPGGIRARGVSRAGAPHLADAGMGQPPPKCEDRQPECRTQGRSEEAGGFLQAIRRDRLAGTHRGGGFPAGGGGGRTAAGVCGDRPVHGRSRGPKEVQSRRALETKIRGGLHGSHGPSGGGECGLLGLASAGVHLARLAGRRRFDRLWKVEELRRIGSIGGSIWNHSGGGGAARNTGQRWRRFERGGVGGLGAFAGIGDRGGRINGTIQIGRAHV